jgi:hypothetical protein
MDGSDGGRDERGQHGPLLVVELLGREPAKLGQQACDRFPFHTTPDARTGDRLRHACR